MSDMTIDAIRALDGKVFAMLDAREKQTFDFFRQRGRKFGVAVSLGNTAPPEDLATARSELHSD